MRFQKEGIYESNYITKSTERWSVIWNSVCLFSQFGSPKTQYHCHDLKICWVWMRQIFGALIVLLTPMDVCHWTLLNLRRQD